LHNDAFATSIWTRVRIQTKTYGFTRQKTRGSSSNLILIFWTGFLIDFRASITASATWSR